VRGHGTTPPTDAVRTRTYRTSVGSGTLVDVGEESAELPLELRHQMDDWTDQVRDQQLGFLEAADDLDERATEIRARLAAAEAAGAPTDGLRTELRRTTELAVGARTMSRVPFLIPDEGVAVREDPAAPDGLAYADPADMIPRPEESGEVPT
jgi:hypothetical protein